MTRRLVLIALASLLACVRLDAHDVVVEQIVRMVVAPESDRLVVRVRVPVTLLNDAGLPRLESGGVDPSASDAALQVVAADVARNLDVRVEAPLRVTRAAAHLASDNRSVDVEIVYALAGRPVNLSARLNAFQGGPLQPPRTDVSYQPPADPPQVLTVAGPPTRVAFDPGLGDVVRQFAVRAFDIVFAGGSHVLFLICLLLPMRPARASARLVTALLVAQGAGTLISTAMPATTMSLVSVDMAAWSVVIGAAFCGIAGVSPRTFVGLGGVFGLLSGIELAASFDGVSQLSGSHASAALLTFILVSLTAELWLAAVMLATRHWLHSVVKHETAVTILASALVVHVAVHRVVDRGQELAAGSLSFTATHAVLLLILAWTLLMVAAALIRLLRGNEPLANRAGSGGAVL